MSREQFTKELHRMGLTPLWRIGGCEIWEHYDDRRVPIARIAFDSSDARIAACKSVRHYLGL